MKSGVYKILNLVNQKCYIGSSFDTSERWKDRLSGLRKSIHINRYLQRAFNTHGENNFKFEVIEYCPNEKGY
jgi:group I intron endonuclease